MLNYSAIEKSKKPANSTGPETAGIFLEKTAGSWIYKARALSLGIHGPMGWTLLFLQE
jgi:hypothetical protein